MSIFKPQCAGFAKFTDTMYVSVFGPVIMAALFGVTFIGTHAASKFSGKSVAMNADRTLNIYLSVFLTFFAGIAAMCMTIFKCHNNPSGKKTLLRDESVVCFEDEWNSLVGLAVVSIIIYIIGFGAMCSYIIAVAPRRFTEVRFQRRWKFLFIKYRPDVWWWIIAFVAKGFVMNLGFVFLDQGVCQLIWIIAFTGMYVGSAMFFNPWRHCSANFFEVDSHRIMLAVLALLI
jgi:hypothetical protein